MNEDLKQLEAELNKAKEALEKSSTSENIRKYGELKAEYDKEVAWSEAREGTRYNIESILNILERAKEDKKGRISREAIDKDYERLKTITEVVETYSMAKRTIERPDRSAKKEIAEGTWTFVLWGLWQISKANTVKDVLDTVGSRVADITTLLQNYIPTRRADKAEDIFKRYGAGGWIRPEKDAPKAGELWSTYKKHVQRKVVLK